MSEAQVLTSDIVAPLLPSGIMMPRGNVRNLNEATTTGTYQVIGNPGVELVGFPSGAYRYGNLVVFGGTTFIVQEYHPHQTKGGYPFYHRMLYRVTGDNWGAWMGFTGTEVPNATT